MPNPKTAATSLSSGSQTGQRPAAADAEGNAAQPIHRHNANA
jgi:hypothetical protein